MLQETCLVSGNCSRSNVSYALCNFFLPLTHINAHTHAHTHARIHTPAAKAPRKTRSELARFVDADYYGYRDEEDGIIVPLEQEQEKKGACMGSSSPLQLNQFVWALTRTRG